MAGEIKLNSVNFASESGGTITVNNGTIGSSVVFPTGHVIKTEMTGAITGSTSDTSDVTITSPTFTTTVENSKIYIMMTLLVRAQGGFIDVRFFHGATELFTGYPIVGSSNGNDNRGVAAWNYLYSPNVSANTTLTFDLKINSYYATTVYISSTTSPSHITFMEIAP